MQRQRQDLLVSRRQEDAVGLVPVDRVDHVAAELRAEFDPHSSIRHADLAVEPHVRQRFDGAELFGEPGRRCRQPGDRDDHLIANRGEPRNQTFQVVEVMSALPLLENERPHARWRAGVVKSGNEAVGIWKASGDRSAMRSAPRSPVRCPG